MNLIKVMFNTGKGAEQRHHLLRAGRKLPVSGFRTLARGFYDTREPSIFGKGSQPGISRPAVFPNVSQFLSTLISNKIFGLIIMMVLK